LVKSENASGSFPLRRITLALFDRLIHAVLHESKREVKIRKYSILIMITREIYLELLNSVITLNSY